MASDDDFIQVKALSVGGRDFSSDTKPLNLDSCTGTKVFRTSGPATVQVAASEAPAMSEPDVAPTEPAPAAPAPPEPDAATAEPAPVQPDAPEPPAPAPELPDACGPGTERAQDGTCVVRTEPVPEGGGCLIATAAYGTELAPQVQLLREARAEIASTGAGSALVHALNSAYYVVSPGIADLQRQSPELRQLTAAALAPAVWTAAALAG